MAVYNTNRNNATNGTTYQVGSSSQAGMTPITQATNTGATSNITTAQQYAQNNTPAAINAGQGATVTNYGQGVLSYNPSTGTITRTMDSGKSYYVDPGQEKYNSIYNEYVDRYGSPVNTLATTESVLRELQNTQVPAYTEPDTSQYEAILQQALADLNQQYTPVDPNEYLKNVMTMDEALDQARMLLDPTYQSARQQALNTAYANLERAGLYDSVYGQNLAMSAENQVTAQQQQAINDLALSLVGQDRQLALSLLQNAVNENQFGASYRQSGLSTAANASMNMINSMIDRARAKNDYLLEAAGLQLEKQAQILEAQYTMGQINQAQLESELLKLEIKAAEAELQATGTVNTVVGGSSGGRSGGRSGSSNRSSSVLPTLTQNSTVSPTGTSFSPDRSTLVTAYKPLLGNAIGNLGLKF